MPHEPSAAGQRWLHEHWPSVVVEHRFRWVAADARGVLMSHTDLEVVVQEAAWRRDSWEHVAFAFVDAQELEPGGEG